MDLVLTLNQTFFLKTPKLAFHGLGLDLDKWAIPPFADCIYI